MGKYRDQAFILDRWSKRLVVYYTERGEKTHIRKYASEDAGCRDRAHSGHADRQG